jgi:glycosyltransferase involved in cell wall biosynthesis
VAISDADRHPDLTYAATIHHGIDLAGFTFQGRPGGYLLFLGRMHPHKGADRAIAVARRAGVPLVLAGMVQDEEYFREQVVPHLDGDQVTYVGSVGPTERDALLGGALALLHLISFAEPFGLSVVEALATGTPVIAHALGSLPELVRDGHTGYLVTGVDEAVTAVGAAHTLDRAACRDDAERRFSADRMVDDYEALFLRVAAGGPIRTNDVE